MINAVGRELPEKIGSYTVRPFTGAYNTPAPEATVVTKRTMGHRIRPLAAESQNGCASI